MRWFILHFAVFFMSAILSLAGYAQGLYSPEKGAIRALVVGIDKYKNPFIVPELQGAVADAVHFKKVLQSANVSDLTVLIDRQATRKAFEKELNGLVDRAQKGDLVIITYAGHGSQEKELLAGSEPDGLDEFIFLWGFGDRKDEQNERILDNEMFHWLRRISAKGAQVIFLSDSCHGGGFSKAVDSRANMLPVRSLERVENADSSGAGRYYVNPDYERDQSKILQMKPDDFATNTIPNLTFISGTDAAKQVPEVRIAGEDSPRGAASYVLAKAFEGHADYNKDGQTTRRELIVYLRRNVSLYSNNRQYPVLEPKGRGGNFVLFHNSALQTQGKTEQKATAGAEKPEKTSLWGRLKNILFQFTKSGIKQDARTGDVVHENGSVIAYGLARSMKRKVLESVTAYQYLAELAQGRTLDLSITPEDRDYILGEKFQIHAKGLAGKYLILVNMTGSGKVQFLYPRRKCGSLYYRSAVYHST